MGYGKEKSNTVGSAAFDMVDHPILLDVLENRLGVRKDVHNWSDSYLRPRWFKVCVNNSFSSDHRLGISVPQGSCAGPVLYNVYASTMQDVAPQGIQIHGYTDDHAFKKAFSAGNNEVEKKTMQNLQDCGADVKNWMDQNRLRINSRKTEFIIFGYRTGEM